MPFCLVFSIGISFDKRKENKMNMIKSYNKDLMRDSLMPSFFNQFFNGLVSESENENRTQFFTPRAEIIEAEKGFHINLEIPGIQKEDIKLEVKNSVLTISGEKKFNQEDKNKKYHRVETYYGRFTRTFNLPENLKKDEIEAELKNGVLNIFIPKAEQALPQTIVIK